MRFFRRIVAIIAACLSAAAAASVAAASHAFAMIVAPPGGPVDFASPATHQGTSDWELAFITLAAVVFVAVSAILLRVQIRVKRLPEAA